MNQLRVKSAIGMVWKSIPAYIGCLQKANCPEVISSCFSYASGLGLHELPISRWIQPNHIKLNTFKEIPVTAKAVESASSPY